MDSWLLIALRGTSGIDVGGRVDAMYGYEYFLAQSNEIEGNQSGSPKWNHEQHGIALAGSFYSLTAGLNYYPHPNITIRPEGRYDWFTGGRNPYNDGNNDNQVLVAISAYLQF